MGTVPMGTGELRMIHSRILWILRPVLRSMTLSAPQRMAQTIFSTSSSIEEVTAELGHVQVESFHGLLVDFCKQRDIPAIVKGLRAVSDFDYELQMAQMNIGLSGVETLFVPTNPAYSFLSSSLVKEVAQWGGDISHLVPPLVLDALNARLRPQ
mgnify:CR=1 FL=1